MPWRRRPTPSRSPCGTPSRRPTPSAAVPAPRSKIAAKAIVADQWHQFSKKDALDKRTTIERLLMIEKAILEEHDGRIASEHILRNLVEKQNDDYINAVKKRPAWTTSTTSTER